MTPELEECNTKKESTFLELINHVQERPIIKEILEILWSKLPATLRYHAPGHTNDVLTEVIFFGSVDNLPTREFELLTIAAAYHDAGFLEAPSRNEPIGAEIAIAAMTRFGGYSTEEQELVRQMIMDTQVVPSAAGGVQLPNSKLSRYLLDADLSNLGRPDFFEKMELQREEIGQDRILFMEQTLSFLNSHRWHTYCAAKFRDQQKLKNLQALRELVNEEHRQRTAITEQGLSVEQLGFLSRMPILLNSSLNPEKVLSVSMGHLREELRAEAATIFLKSPDSEELIFWVSQGPSKALSREGRRMPTATGIVGWTIAKQESVLIPDASNDPRFFATIDKESGFKTRDVLCVPLTARGTRQLGAVQVLNCFKAGGFARSDLHFLEQFAIQIALAIDNARLYEELKKRSKKLALLEKRKNEMISVIGHEFKTPLNVIRSAADLLTSGTLSPDVQMKMQKTLQDGVSRLSRLVGEVRNIGLVSSAKLEPSKAAVALTKLFEQLEEQFRVPLTMRVLELKKQKASPGAASVVCDPQLISLVLNNLLSNAIRFTPDGGTITLSASVESGLAEIGVEDTGIGIDPDQIPAIFEKFYEVGSALQHSSGTFEFRSAGLGLGLATAQSILNSHGSSLKVKSNLGQGSKFFFHLPVELASP